MVEGQLAVDQGGQVRAELDSAVVPSVRGQPGASVSVQAYNLGNFLRRLCLPKAVKHWSLRSVQVKLIKIRHVKRYPILSVAEVSVPVTVVPGKSGAYQPVIAGRLRRGCSLLFSNRTLHDFEEGELRLVFNAPTVHPT